MPMRPRTIKAWYLVHKWTSLPSTLFLLMLCVTGLPLIFHHEIDHALGYSVDPPRMPPTSARASIDSMVAKTQRQHPGDAMQFLVGDLDEPDVWFVRMGESPDGHITAFDTYDARTGELLGKYPLEQGVMNVILRLHVDMFAGLPGTLFLGAMGVLLVGSLVSGAVLYAPFMSRLTFGTVRQARSSRIRWLDMHNVVGIVTAMWLLIVGGTGVINALHTPIFERWQTTQLAAMTAPYRDAAPVTHPASIDAAVASAHAALPGTRLSFMAFPGTSFAGPSQFVAYMQGTSPATSRLLAPVVIDARTSVVVATGELPWYVSTLLLSQPLHFGDFGGIPLKLLWAVLDVLSIVVLASGVVLWVKRRRRPFEEWSASRAADGVELAA